MGRNFKYEILEDNKICTRCGVLKNFNEFSKCNNTYDSLQSACKSCKKLDREKSKQKAKEYNKKYRNKNKDKLNQYYSNWYKNNKKKVNKYWKIRYKNDPIYKITLLLRNRLKELTKNNSEKLSILYIIGCSNFELKQYLESQFKPEMNWSNHGEIWEIDHIKPCSLFNLENEKEQKECFHFSNLQPLFKTTEIAKSFGYLNEIGNRNKSNTT